MELVQFSFWVAHTSGQILSNQYFNYFHQCTTSIFISERKILYSILPSENGSLKYLFQISKMKKILQLGCYLTRIQIIILNKQMQNGWKNILFLKSFHDYDYWGFVFLFHWLLKNRWLLDLQKRQDKSYPFNDPSGNKSIIRETSREHPLRDYVKWRLL